MRAPRESPARVVSVLAGPVDIPTVGRMAIIQDPTGGVIGIIKYARPGGSELRPTASGP